MPTRRGGRVCQGPADTLERAFEVVLPRRSLPWRFFDTFRAFRAVARGDTPRARFRQAATEFTCLNEAETIVACVRKAREFVRASDIVEVLIADNGSTDGSQQLAAREGARVLLVSIVLASLNFTLMKFWAFAERA